MNGNAGEICQVKVKDVCIGGNKLALIAGPCAIESEDHVMFMAEKLRGIAQELSIPYIFKASFDKANRSSVGNYRGPGMDKGLEILAKVKKEFDLPVLSDIHESSQAAAAGEVLDILQIPAFLCRQTDLLVAAGKTGKTVNIKKAQFLSPWDMKNAVEKVRSTGNNSVMLTERGTSFGYNNLVCDMRSLPSMRSLGVPVVFDATHSVQLPGGLGSASGGDREMAYVLTRAAVAAGIDALFLEVHDQPDKALCDGPNMVELQKLPPLLKTVLAIRDAVS